MCNLPGGKTVKAINTLIGPDSHIFPQCVVRRFSTTLGNNIVTDARGRLDL